MDNACEYYRKQHRLTWAGITGGIGIVIAGTLGIQYLAHKSEPKKPQAVVPVVQSLTLEPLSITSENNYWISLVGRPEGEKPILCVSDSIVPTINIEALVQSEINDGDNETIRVTGREIPSKTGKPYFNFTSIEVQGYKFPE